MPRPLTNRQLWVLAYVREHPGCTINQVWRDSPVDVERTAAFKEDHDVGDEVNFEIRSLHYADAYQALKRLMKDGLVERTASRDSFGDEHMPWRWSATEADPHDPLERAFAAPAAEGGEGD
jgi:hypothetical protein